MSRSLGVSVVIIISSQLELSGLSLGWVKTAALPPLLGWWWCGDCICLVMAPPQLIKLQHDREQVAPHPGLIPTHTNTFTHQLHRCWSLLEINQDALPLQPTLNMEFRGSN